jgi:replicative DNA helicase
MKSKYVDTNAIMNVIGYVFNHPNVLELDEKYSITDDDFTEKFHKIVFGTIYKIYKSGIKDINLQVVSNFLSQRPEAEAIFNINKGTEYLIKVSEMGSDNNFDYYYNRLKKMTLFRAYESLGYDPSKIYDPDNAIDLKKRQRQEDWVDNHSLVDIVNVIDTDIDSIRKEYIEQDTNEIEEAGEGILDLLDRLKHTPEVGVPLFGPLINTITRGARLKKFYLRSMPTGVGKTRMMVADACNIGCEMIYSKVYNDWIENGTAEPTLYITTELEKEEVQTMMCAFLADVDEEHILNGSYEDNEEQRVKDAAQLIVDSPIYILEIPDFSLADIENAIKRGIRNFNVKYVFYDYIHTSLSILEEVASRSGGMKLREDNILFMLSIKLKDLCNKYGIFIMSSTQLNGDYKDAKTIDQNLLRGAKAIADKVDIGMIGLPVKEEDLETLKPIINSGGFKEPNLKISIYKNRRGKYKGDILWCNADLSTCRVRPMFLTNQVYKMLPIEDTRVIVEEEEGAFE